MDRAADIPATPKLLCLLLAFLLFTFDQPGVEAARIGRVRTPPHGVAGSVVKAQLSAADHPISTHTSAHTDARVKGAMPPCDKPWLIPGLDCMDPITGPPLPPCDIHHTRPGFDCQPGQPGHKHVMTGHGDPATTTSSLQSTGVMGDQSVPASSDEIAAAGGGTHAVSIPSGNVKGMLPPCTGGLVPGLECFDPPTTPLPPCDFHHQRRGFDCWR